VAEAVEVPVIASGGAGCIDHIAEALTEGRAAAALLASLLHDGVLTVEEIKRDLLRRGLPIRPLLDDSAVDVPGATAARGKLS
jgi:cyclase